MFHDSNHTPDPNVIVAEASKLSPIQHVPSTTQVADIVNEFAPESVT
jgi:hypothetical protein